MILIDAAAEGLDQVEITTDLDNVNSQRVIVANGGELVGRFPPGPACGDSDELRYVIRFPSGLLHGRSSSGRGSARR